MEMKEGVEYKIEKLEKGPLQRFKNQNLLLKKFGEMGLQVYKVITGKRTSEELRKDLDMEPELFNQILSYMQEAGMVQLSPAEEKGEPSEEKPSEEIPKEAATEFEEEAPKKKKKPTRVVPEEAPVEEELPPEEEATEEEQPTEEVKEEIVPEFEEEAPKKKKKPIKEELPEEEEAPAEEELPPEEAVPEEGGGEELPSERISFGAEAIPEKEEGESPVETIIRDKYGDIGIQVYNLIDGQRTAEEIMEETGLSESKLVEILDFLDEQGIIKLEYPKGKPEATPIEEKPKEAAESFAPMVEAEEEAEQATIKEVSPDLIPARLSLSFIGSVQLRAKTRLRHGDIGDKILAAIDGKSDLIDISMKLNISLYKLMDILSYLKQENAVTMNQIGRNEVRAKYGEDGYTVYKRYGKEGLMLYELIGKEMSIKDMADRITTDKAKVVDMFLFIYEVLGIEMPINKEALMKQLGL